VTVSSVKPSTLRIDLDRVMSKTVSLRAAFDSNSKLPEGYAVARSSFPPSDVRVTAQLRGRAHRVPPDASDPLSSITQSFEYSAEVANAGSNLKISPSKARCRSVIRRARRVSSRTSRSDLALLRLQAPLGGDLSAPNAEIAVVGPRSQIELMRDEEVKPFIDISQFEQPGSTT
jgi:hypothetical protein